MYNTAKVDYLLCGSLEDEEKAKIRSKWLLCGKGWEGACAVSGRHNVSVTRGQGCLYL